MYVGLVEEKRILWNIIDGNNLFVSDAWIFLENSRYLYDNYATLNKYIYDNFMVITSSSCHDFDIELGPEYLN